MRARIAIYVAGRNCILREVALRNKPDEMIAASQKGTVPVLVLPNGEVIDESLDIMMWALKYSDPEGWLSPLENHSDEIFEIISTNDGSFKQHLDRYKYPDRYHDVDPLYHREQGKEYLKYLNNRLSQNKYLFGDEFTLADAAIVPFIRQFANNDRKWFDALNLNQIQLWLKDILESEQFNNIMTKYPVWKNGVDELIFPPLKNSLES